MSQFNDNHFTRFFNSNYCLHVQKERNINKVWTLSFGIAPKERGHIQFDKKIQFQLMPKELNILSRMLVTRQYQDLEFPYHNKKTLKIQFQVSSGNNILTSVNINIVTQDSPAFFAIPADELFSLTTIAINAIATRDNIDTISVITLFRSGH